SHFTAGYEQFNRVVARYRSEPWFRDLRGEYTGEMVRHSEAEIRIGGPQQDQGTTWNFDAESVLRRVTAPLLWMIAGADTQGPGEESRANLVRLNAEGRPITVAVFPNTEHGIHEFRLAANG